MSNNTEDNRFQNSSLLSNESAQANSAPDLDALFSGARQSQPNLRDDNFTKVVVNSLPKSPARRRNQGLSFDVIGIILGLLAVYAFFDVGRFASGIVNSIPQTITLSPLHALAILAVISGMSILAWWTVENNRS